MKIAILFFLILSVSNAFAWPSAKGVQVSICNKINLAECLQTPEYQETVKIFSDFLTKGNVTSISREVKESYVFLSLRIDQVNFPFAAYSIKHELTKEVPTAIVTLSF